ncbi:MAG: KTSC domain-containing protein [Clostridia bacterium]|nr:KTSC domain-containing protein [Clostridia bacterium]
MHRVESSQILSVGYSQESETMYVEFVNRQVYRYLDVPSNVFNNLKNSSSPGRFFLSSVKQYYDYSKTDLSVVNGTLTIEYEPNRTR